MKYFHYFPLSLLRSRFSRFPSMKKDSSGTGTKDGPPASHKVETKAMSSAKASAGLNVEQDIFRYLKPDSPLLWYWNEDSEIFSVFPVVSVDVSSCRCHQALSRMVLCRQSVFHPMFPNSYYSGPCKGISPNDRDLSQSLLRESTEKQP